ncbi:MAG: RNA 2',3'-cyclic phosphodiesterase [Candidatus Nanohaloarchaea archaeon]|nr:RNA 2',3'-cyclic phosphodiesterase [Candidatus Nanohaloarchaea archaeon]
MTLSRDHLECEKVQVIYVFRYLNVHMSRRCFISIDIEGEGLRSSLESFQQKISGIGLSNPTSPSNFHITLNFIGEIGENKLAEVRKNLNSLSMPSFEFSVEGIGVFPDRDFIKVVWAGVGQGRERMENLAEAVRSKLDPELVQDREFHPHITLSRVKKIGREEKRELQSIIDKNQNRVFGSMEADSFRLKESILKEGAKHRTIEVFDLE